MITAGYLKKYSFFTFISAAIFAVFFIFSSTSYSQEGNFNKEKAIQVVLEQGGPGGCDSEASCAAFCDNQDNFETCTSWARSNGVIVSEENFEKQSRVVRQGGPGGCQTPGACRAFCEQPGNHDVCIDHAVQEGFMTRDEAQKIREFQTRADEFRKKAEEFRRQAGESRRPEVREVDPGFDENKARQILATQGGPGGCATFEECESFCDNSDNQSACFEFAEQNGLFTNKEEAEKIKRIMQEGGPGGCRGEKECHQFCENEANFEVCISFAEKSGLMPPEEIERAKKGIQALKEGGPAGCKTRETCESVCQDPANQQSCFEWAKKHGLMSDEELRFIEESQKIREQFDSRRQEFEGRHQDDSRPPEGFQPPGEFLGPGGCTGAEECRKYCEDPTHKEECGGFRTPSGQQPPGFGGNQPSEFNRPPEFNNPPPSDFQEFKQETHNDPSVECANHGGSWTGATCEFPRQEEFQSPPPEFKQEQEPTSQPTSLREHPFLGAMLRYLLK